MRKTGLAALLDDFRRQLLLVSPLQVVGRQLVQETAWFAFADLAVALPVRAVAECEGALGARDADIGQAALFLDVVGFDAVLMRQQVFFHADQEHMWKLQALGGMQGHQADLVAGFFLLIAFHDVHQHDFGDDLGQRFSLAIFFIDAFEPVDQFLDVLHFALGRRRRLAVFAQPLFVAYLIQHGFDHGEGVAAFDAVGRIDDPVAEFGQPLHGFFGQFLSQAQFGAGCEQADMALVGIGAEFFQRGRADLAARRVDDAQEGGIVVLIDEQAQVAEHVLDFGIGEKRRAAADEIRDVVFAQAALEQPRLVIAAV